MTLEARDLTCRRDGRALFAPVTVRLDPGQALLLKGPNGAGKTTLIRAIAGLGAAPDGRVTLAGRPLGDGAVALTGHLDAVKPGLTVAENLGFWAALSGTAERLDQALAAFDLAPLRARLAGRLSAGQRRRLGLARLAVTDAPLWLLDEPTVSLDVANTAALGRLLADHLGRGGYAIIATHLPVPVEAETLTLRPASAEVAADSDPFLDAALAEAE